MKVIIDVQQHPNYALEDYPCVTVHRATRLNYSAILKCVQRTATSVTDEDTLVVVMAGLHSVLDTFTAVSFGNSPSLSEEAVLDTRNMSARIADSMIAGSCDVWSTVLSSTKQSDVVFMQVPPLTLTDKPPYLRGSRKHSSLVSIAYNNVLI